MDNNPLASKYKKLARQGSKSHQVKRKSSLSRVKMDVDVHCGNKRRKADLKVNETGKC